jgi:plastocyanin
MAINQLYLIKSGQNSFVEETEALLGISGGNIGFGTVNPESYVHITGDTKIDGDLTVQGDFRTVNQTTIQIDDKNIELGVGAVTDQDVDGGGITLRGLTDKTINWQASNNAWNLNTSLSVGGSGFFESGVFINGQPVALRSQISERIWESHPRYVNNIYNVSISGDGNNYLFSEDFIGADPSLKLFLGEAVIFDNIGGGHTLAIKDSEGNNVVNESNNKTNFIPSSTGVYTYYCKSHPSSMQGEINVYNYKEISYNYGNVGIGTINPSFDLDVLGEGNFSKGLYVSGNPVLTGTAEDLGKWEDGAEAGEIFYNAGNVGIGTDNPSYNLEVKGSGNFSEGLYVNGNSVLTGSTSDLGKWEDGTEAGEIFYNAGNVGIGTDNPSVNLDIVGKAQVSESFSVSNIFSIDDQGRVGGQTPFSNDVIQWDGLKWVAAQSAGGGSNGGGEVPSAFLYNLSSGESIQQVSFGQTFNVIPGIATNLEINGEGSIIPYIISGLSTSGYNAVFAKKIPNNNYRIHTVFGGTVQGSSALTGKWEDSVTAGEIYYNGGNVGIGTIDPAYSLHVNGTIYNQNGGINVANKFNVSTLGAVGGQSPDFNEVIKWDGTKWIAGSAPGGGATSSSEAPSAFDTWLNQGSAIQAISFVDAPEGGYQSIPSISTDVEIIEGDIIPYAISGVSTTGYYAVFSDPIPTANNYKIHTTFGGKEVYWQTGAGGNSIYYDGDDVSVDNLTVGGNLTVNGTQTIVNTETMEIEDHNLVIAANTGHNQLTAEYPGAGGAYAGILWGTGDAGAASPVSLTYQSNKGFAFEGGNVGIGTTSPHSDLHIGSNALAGKTEIRIENMGGYSLLGLARENDDIIVGSKNADLVINNTTATDIILGTDDSERMRIDSDGNVGIGTTDPNFKTSIVAGPEDTTPIALALSVDDTGLVAGQGVTLGFGQLDTVFSKIESFYQDSDGFGLKIYTGTKSTSTGTDRTKDEPSLTIDNNGNVGIGTTSPDETLHVSSLAGPLVAIFEHADGGSSELAFQDTNQQNQIRIGTADSGFRVFTADEERMRIDSNGNVGIGTTNPLAKFDIRTKGDTFNDGLIVKTNTGGQRSVRMWVDGSTQKAHIGAGQGTQDLILNHAGGYVGIGTTDPTSLLHVKTSGTGGALVIESDDDGSTYAPDFLLFRNSETPAADDNLGEIKFRGRNDNDPQSSIDYTMIRSRIKSPTNNNERGELTFWTRGGSSLFQRMVLDADGNVGIGTETPGGFKLNVQSDASTVPIKGYRATSTATSYLIALNSNIGTGSDVVKFRVEADGDVISATNSYTSDERAKTAISDLNYGIDTINQLQPKQFKMLHSEEKGFKYGFVAQEIETVLPDLVRDDGVEDGEGGSYKALEYNSIIAVLTKAIQEQQQTIEDLKSRLETLEQ